jgi:hypothetical protein
MYLENKECPVCQKVTAFHNGLCSECEARKRREKEHKWQSMSYDDRLTDLLRRVEGLEQGPPRY